MNVSLNMIMLTFVTQSSPAIMLTLKLNFSPILINSSCPGRVMFIIPTVYFLSPVVFELFASSKHVTSIEWLPPVNVNVVFA